MTAEISRIERAAQLAWPALEDVRDGHWVARFARGYTKRANSIQSFDVADDADAGSRIDDLASRYRAAGLKPVFRVTPLAGSGIIAALDERGWTPFETSLVLAMDMDGEALPVPVKTRFFEPTDPEWRQGEAVLAGYDAATADTLGAILNRLSVPARGILVYDEADDPVGAALAVNAEGMAIFLNVVVDKAMRGRGYGRAVMHAALNWTRESGATQAALQVLADNEAAIALYRSLGFADAYSYHYRRPSS